MTVTEAVANATVIVFGDGHCIRSLQFETCARGR